MCILLPIGEEYISNRVKEFQLGEKFGIPIRMGCLRYNIWKHLANITTKCTLTEGSVDGEASIRWIWKLRW